MPRPSITRRRLLLGAGLGGAALVLELPTPPGALASVQEQTAGGITPELLTQLAQYGGFPLSPEHAAANAPLVAGALAAMRQARPPGFGDVMPAPVFRVPEEGDDAS